MLTIKTFQVNMIGENCYVVSDETREAVVIDCGAFSAQEKQAIANYIEAERLQVKHLLCTHVHFDHVFGNAFLAERYGLKPAFHAADQPLYDNLATQVMDFIQVKYDVPQPPAAPHLADGDEVRFGTHAFTVIHTPGHSPGGVSFYCAAEGVLFSGDSLFRYSIGRTDLTGGDYRALIDSLSSKILTLPEQVTVYPGHGPTTTVGAEKRNNPYLL